MPNYGNVRGFNESDIAPKGEFFRMPITQRLNTFD